MSDVRSSSAKQPVNRSAFSDFPEYEPVSLPFDAEGAEIFTGLNATLSTSSVRNGESALMTL